MLALQALCVLDAVGESFAARLNAFFLDEAVLTDLQIESPPEEELLEFAQRLVARVRDEHKVLDDRLQRLAARWTIARMPPVDRNILRLGLSELRDAADAKSWQAILSEATDLARRFGDTDSPSFVNGILDAARKELGYA
jgi:N utilization substance protein B